MGNRPRKTVFETELFYNLGGISQERDGHLSERVDRNDFKASFAHAKAKNVFC